MAPPLGEGLGGVELPERMLRAAAHHASSNQGEGQMSIYEIIAILLGVYGVTDIILSFATGRCWLPGLKCRDCREEDEAVKRGWS